MPNLEQLEAEKTELEQRYKRIEQELSEFQLAYCMLVAALMGLCAGYLVCWLSEG